MLEFTPELFVPEHMVRHAVHATGKLTMKDTKSLAVKKTLDEESIKLSAMERVYVQKHESQVKKKKMNPLETLRRANLEQKISSKEQGLRTT